MNSIDLNLILCSVFLKLHTVNKRAKRHPSPQTHEAVHGSAVPAVQGDVVIPESSPSEQYRRSCTFFVPAKAGMLFALLEFNCIVFSPLADI